MARKSFINDNPALRFISDQQESGEQTESKTSSAKKSETSKYKPDPKYIETKSRRVQLIMQPSLYDSIKSAADREKVSVNEFIHATLEKALKQKK